MGQYSDHRRPTAVPKLERVQRDDPLGKDELRLRQGFQKAMEAATGKPQPKRKFSDLVKKK